MKKTHSTLRPGTNLFLIILWGALCSILFFGSTIKPTIILLCGVVLGCVGGILQTLSFNEAKASFLEASTMLEVRKKLRATKWGKRYIYFLWSGNALLAITAFKFTPNPLSSVLVGFLALMFIRELITLKPTYELAKLRNV